MIFFSNLLIKLDVPLHRKKHMSQKLQGNKRWFAGSKEEVVICHFTIEHLLKYEQIIYCSVCSSKCLEQIAALIICPKDTWVPCRDLSVVEWHRYMWYVILTVCSSLNACENRLADTYLINKLAKKQSILYIQGVFLPPPTPTPVLGMKFLSKTCYLRILYFERLEGAWGEV